MDRRAPRARSVGRASGTRARCVWLHADRFAVTAVHVVHVVHDGRVDARDVPGRQVSASAACRSSRLPSSAAACSMSAAAQAASASAAGLVRASARICLLASAAVRAAWSHTVLAARMRPRHGGPVRRSPDNLPPASVLGPGSRAGIGTTAARDEAAVLSVSAHLTERDRELIRLVARHRVLTTGQLAAFAFGNITTATRRPSVLVRLGLCATSSRAENRLGSAALRPRPGRRGAAGQEDCDEKGGCRWSTTPAARTCPPWPASSTATRR